MRPVIACCGSSRPRRTSCSDSNRLWKVKMRSPGAGDKARSHTGASRVSLAKTRFRQKLAFIFCRLESRSARGHVQKPVFFSRCRRAEDPIPGIVEPLDGNLCLVYADLGPTMVEFNQQLLDGDSCLEKIVDDLIFRTLDVHLQ